MRYLCTMILAITPTSSTLSADTTLSRAAASRAAIERDWMLQDYMGVPLPAKLEGQRNRWRKTHLSDPESRHDDPVLANLTCFLSQSHSVVERRMVERVAQETGSHRETLLDEINALSCQGLPGKDPRWKQLYLRACELRRATRLQPLLAKWTRFVFNCHAHVRESWKYTEVLSDARTDRHRYFNPGATLHVLELQELYGQVRCLLADPHGMLRNPDVSYDGQRLLFAWKKSDRDDDFHLYEMQVSTGHTRQLTHGLGFADFEGVYLPDGNILFSSTRCEQSVPCNWVDVSNLYLMNGNGEFMRRVGFDQVHTVFPTVTDDNRVLYTRWEYSDRGQIYPQPLFRMNPDGTNQRELYGVNSWFPTNIIHARKIPDSRKVLAVVTGHHRPAHGKLALIDTAAGRQEGHGVELIAPRRTTEYARVDRYALQGNQFQYPYPLDEHHFLVTLALPTPTGGLGRFDLFFMDDQGRRELLVEGGESGDTGMGCHQIIPLAPRPQTETRSSVVDYRKNSGTFYVQDVYKGPGLKDVPRGTVKRLRVVALDYRAAAIGRLSQEGKGGNSEMTTPIAIGNGAWDVKRVLGTATVYEDGSAMFEVPARTPVYFMALDERNQAIQVMRSWTVVMPGEALSCVGCHDHKNAAPPADHPATQAMKGGPQSLVDFYGPPRGFSFAAEIQPILDRSCVSCHHPDGGDAPCLIGRPVVMKDMKRFLSESYLALTHANGSNGDSHHPLVNWIDSMSEPSMLPPYHRGSATSGLMTLLREGHQNVRLTCEELEKFACWIDLLVPYCGDYIEANDWSVDELDYYQRYSAKRARMQRIEQANIEALIQHRGVDGKTTD